MILVKGTFLSVLGDGDNLYMHDSAVTLKSLFIIYHSVLRFITVGYNIRHCNLCVKDGWHSLSFDVRAPISNTLKRPNDVAGARCFY